MGHHIASPAVFPLGLRKLYDYQQSAAARDSVGFNNRDRRLPRPHRCGVLIIDCADVWRNLSAYEFATTAVEFRFWRAAAPAVQWSLCLQFCTLLGCHPRSHLLLVTYSYGPKKSTLPRFPRHMNLTTPNARLAPIRNRMLWQRGPHLHVLYRHVLHLHVQTKRGPMAKRARRRSLLTLGK